MLAIFDSLELAGAYVYEFISPGSPHLPDPRFDLDLATFAIVKAIADRPPGTSPAYRWEPKQAFRALADYYEASR